MDILVLLSIIPRRRSGKLERGWNIITPHDCLRLGWFRIWVWFAMLVEHLIMLSSSPCCIFVCYLSNYSITIETILHSVLYIVIIIIIIIINNHNIIIIVIINIVVINIVIIIILVIIIINNNIIIIVIIIISSIIILRLLSPDRMMIMMTSLFYFAELKSTEYSYKPYRQFSLSFGFASL